MDIVTVDFETFYGDGYTLSSMTTEEYVRDPRFESILCSFKVNDEKGFWVPRDKIAATARALELEKCAVLHHHAHFDGLIACHHYGVRPRLFFDTLSMARALHGANGRLSLEKLAERYGIGKKGTEVVNARNLRYKDFGPQQLARYGEYSVNDCDLTYQLFLRMARQFSRVELEIMDQVIRMFTDPILQLDAKMLGSYADGIRAEKTTLMLQAGVQVADLMSNDKFADALRELDVDPPMKISKTTNKLTYAFAKTDPGMQALQEHPDERVQILTEARLKNKTTLAEKGALRLIGMAGRGAATVYYKYSGASGTHRLSGGDKFNWQAMKRGSDLRNAIMARDGHAIVVVDSSTIEARWLDWLAGQDDMVEVYRRQDAKTGPDMYCVIAERIYERPINKIDDPDERQMGKVAKLGLGFGMGDQRFIFAVRGQAKVKTVVDGKVVEKPLIIKPEFAKKVVGIYRDGHPQVKKLWKRGEDALRAISQGLVGVPVDFRGIVKTCKDGLEFPGGLKILYPDLQKVKADNGIFEFEWEFWNGKMRERIYGAKVIENIIQCLARITVFEQCLAASKEVKAEARWVMSTHDEGIFHTHLFDAPYVLEVVTRHFRKSPKYAPDLPLNCEGGFHQRYGKAKK